MSASTRSATAMPGVRSSSIRTPSGSMATRAACRYSSRRWADVGAAVVTATTSAMTARRLFRELRTVVVGRITVDRVNVIDVPLRRVLDHERRPMHPEIRRAAVDRRAAPGEIRIGEVAADLRHPRFGVRVVHDAGPLADEVEEHRLLRPRQRRRTKSFGLNRLAVLARA